MSDIPNGMIPATPSPRIARPNITDSILVADISSIVPEAKITIPIRINRRGSTPSLNRPYTGISSIKGSMNAAETQAVISACSWNSSRIIGRATRDIVETIGISIDGNIRLNMIRRAC